MKVSILSAMTGNGHTSVAKSLKLKFNQYNIECKVYDNFYESMCITFCEMSDFYNLLQTRSRQLCSLYTEMSLLESDEKKKRKYNEVKPFLERFFIDDNSDLYISVAPIINYYVLEFFKEKNIIKPYFIVITDPYKPIYPGFTCIGANRYFVANDTVKNILLNDGIPENKISITGFPVRDEFLVSKSELYNKDNERNLLINSGANGCNNYIKLLEYIINFSEWNIIVTCGNNSQLYSMLKRKYGDYKKLTLLLYADKMWDVLDKVDLCITKAGANSVYECIYKGVPIFVDCRDGILYQEKGVIELINQYHFGDVFFSVEELYHLINKFDEKFNDYIMNIGLFQGQHACDMIIKTIVNEVN